MATMPEPFCVGDLVLLSTEEIDATIQPPKFVGPYKIQECLSEASFRIQVPGSMGVEGVFRLSSLIRFSSGRGPSRETTPSSGVVNSASLGGGKQAAPIQGTKNKKEKTLLVIGDNVGIPRDEHEHSKQVSSELDRQVSAGTVERSQDSRPKTRKLRKKYQSPTLAAPTPDAAARDEEGEERPRGIQTSVSREDGSEQQVSSELDGSRASQRRLKRLRKVERTAVCRDNPTQSQDKIKQEVGQAVNQALKAEEAQCSTDPSRRGADEGEEEGKRGTGHNSSGAPADQAGAGRSSRDDAGKQKMLKEEEETPEDGTMVVVDGEPEWEVESILEDRLACGGRRGREYLVKWKGYSVQESTWEPRANLTHVSRLLKEFINRKKKKSAGSAVRDS
ncbi:chromodomain-helicase-DNA-binding protein 2 isoform X1 [Selaginella moellendorffii]|uniref:chromodomain-helicase-DNA-binding protein 2 isoform X1 n=1 Tax=Selaginella moellendorffii TaxID=88036 RepID=UPI000D1CE9DB|nr:chromodomain-helicase-DNA-binding protein 2 isoform X1 [Selaginella moellendorffii]|eukprot:XP_024542312.1 chromodomain-helicase-DNA-binding protein 2 isoform X1 [Selaginella moellendorffii]